MRDIKFRQYIPKTKAFHYWGLIKEGVFVGPMDKRFAKDSEQYTGLKDRNGKEIYEGDIVKPAGYGNKMVVEYDDIQLRDDMTAPGAGYQFNDYPNEMEVIGNIYDNPELLEGVQS